MPGLCWPYLFLCCSLDARCNDTCNPNTLRQAHLRAGYSSICRPLLTCGGQAQRAFLAMFSLLGVITAVLLYLVMFNVQTDSAHTWNYANIRC